MNINNLNREDVFREIKDRVDSGNDDVEVISIVGGAGSGKTTFAHELVLFLKDACTLSTDDYVVGDREYRRKYLEGKDPLQKYNQAALNENISVIKNLKDEEFCFIPTYDDVTGEAVDAKKYHKKISCVKYIIVEGDFDFVENPDLLVYFDVDDDTRLYNRIQRDLEKGREVDEESIRENFNLRQELQHKPYTEPVKNKADMVIVARKKNKSDDDMYEYNIIQKDKMKRKGFLE